VAKARRARGDGGWHELPDGRIKHSISLGFDAAGKRLRPTVYGATKDECRALMAQKIEKIRKAGGIPLADDTTVDQWLKAWLERRKRDVAGGTLTEDTLKGYRQHVRDYITPRPIARIRLDQLTVRDGKAWKESLEDAGVGGRACQYVRMIFVAAMNAAVDDELVERNVMERVPVPAHTEKEFEVWGVDEALAFLKAAETDRFYAFWVLWLATGPRPHETLGLRPEDVDLERGEVAITKQLRRRRNERAKTKTVNARRTLVLAPFAIEALRAHRNKMFAEGLRASPWFFPNTLGKAMNYRNLIEDHYDKIVKRADRARRRELAAAALREADGPAVGAAAGVPLEGNLSDREIDRVADHLKIVGLRRIRPYDLRHTYATFALKAGVPAHVVSEALGHATVAFTLDTYAHILSSMRDDHAAKIQRLFVIEERPAATPAKRRYRAATRSISAAPERS
jgi:integrase